MYIALLISAKQMRNIFNVALRTLPRVYIRFYKAKWGFEPAFETYKPHLLHSVHTGVGNNK